MASTPEAISPAQLRKLRAQLSHADGSALLTTEAAGEWLAEVGMVPVKALPQFAAPQPALAEAVLGRPETGWTPAQAKSADAPDGSDEESLAIPVEEEEPEEGDDDQEDAEDQEDDAEDDADAEDSSSDDEVMVSDDDLAAEDEGDEIAEVDRIEAQGNPVPNDVVANEATSAADDALAVEPVQPVNGFNEDERETVRRTLARMIEEGSAVPLNLLGGVSTEPDFVCSPQAFSFIYTLRGDKGWKAEPSETGSMRVSPLAVKTFAALKDKGEAMTASELATELGKGVVQSAVQRALSELWAVLRVLPMPDVDGGDTRWELTTARYTRHLKAGSNAGLPTALSALLSLYLAKVGMATSDEMEVYLSPLAARSRVREVVTGLAAARQLEPMVVAGKHNLYIAGALPEIPADDAPAAAPLMQRSRYEADDLRAKISDERARPPRPDSRERKAPSKYPVRRPAGMGGDRPPMRRSSPGGSFAGRSERPAGGDRERRPFTRSERPTSVDGDVRSERPAGNTFARPWDEESPRKPFVPRDGGERRPYTPRPEGERRPYAPRAGAERRPYTPREGGDRRPYTPRPDGDRSRRPFTPREDGERRPYTPREGGERRPYTPRPAAGGERRPFVPREGGGRRPYTPRPEGDRPRRPFTPREGGESRPYTPRSNFGDRKPYTPRDGGERRPYTPRPDGDRPRRPFTPRVEGDRPRSFTPGEGGGERRPFTPRPEGDRRPFSPRSGGSDRKPFTPRDGGERRPFTPRGDGERRPFTPREGGERRPFTPRGDGERRPFTPREGGRPAFAGAKPSFGRGPSKFGAKPGGFGSKPGGFGGRPGASSSGRGPGAGGGKPFGAKRPFTPKRRPE